MFLEKHEPSTIEEYNWFDESGTIIDSEAPLTKMQISKINRYIIELDEHRAFSQFINWLFHNKYKIYCLDDLKFEVRNMTNIQRILFEKEKSKENWKQIGDKNIYYIELKSEDDVTYGWDSLFFFSKESFNCNALWNLYNELKLNKSRFPNLSFTKILPKNKDFIIGRVSMGESYFKPGTNEETDVLICYTAQKI